MDSNYSATLTKVTEDMKSDYRTYYNGYKKVLNDETVPHVSIEKTEGDKFGAHDRVDVTFSDSRYYLYSDYHRKVFTSWTGDENIDADIIEKDVKELMADYDY